MLKEDPISSDKYFIRNTLINSLILLIVGGISISAAAGKNYLRAKERLELIKTPEGRFELTLKEKGYFPKDVIQKRNLGDVDGDGRTDYIVNIRRDKGKSTLEIISEYDTKKI